mmetsp:Transcript_80753/g.227316  ORF Transcript_80753/g.227316 Transcript_80753/m.227316 type:complete len:458 (-) Transcript_80753:148-1521(-)
MVHSIKVTWSLGFGLVDEKQAFRMMVAIEAGYFVGSLLFTAGTVYFFPVEGLEDVILGCRLYELGSVVFGLLTLYSQLDRLRARRRKDAGRNVTIRELVEECLYCLGSFVFLIGTFLFDPPCVKFLAILFGIPGSHIENTAAVLFMLGSFMFSLGSYVNALSIFEAPKTFRLHYISVTTCYQFGGLLFVAGTMGYVEAFKPNKTMRWVSTWFYLVGCLFYVVGSFLSFVSCVARHQVRWERLQEKNDTKRKRSVVRILGRTASAIPRALLAAAGGRKRRSGGGGHGRLEEDAEEGGVSPCGVRLDLDFASESPGPSEDLDLEDGDGLLEERLAALLGENAGRELAAALRSEDGGDKGEEEQDVFGAFWRSVWTAGPTPPWTGDGCPGSGGVAFAEGTTAFGAAAPVAAAEAAATAAAHGQGHHAVSIGASTASRSAAQQTVSPFRDRDNLTFMDERS